jgi:NAD(P)-dependent dehydrogenase (short-subunit alcohol dehydrogenase family)
MSDLNFHTAFDLLGKTVVITGAAGGIGREMARVFAERGSRLALVDRDATVNDLSDALGGSCHSFIADLQDESDIVRTVTAITERFGGIDILINNAGIGIVGKAIDFKTDDWDRTMAINLRAQFIFAREVAPYMRAVGWGRIVVISSQAAVVGIDEHVAYSASKAGLLGMVRCMAIEWGRDGITVNAISPTVVETPMALVGWAGEKGERAKAEIPTGRFAKPVEIALAALYLSSHAAGMITGANLMVDGGMTIR